MGDVQKLRALWREVDALGGTARTEYDVGYCQGVLQASIKLEEAGFSEGQSKAADTIEALLAALKEARTALAIYGSTTVEKKLLPEIDATIAKATA